MDLTNTILEMRSHIARLDAAIKAFERLAILRGIGGTSPAPQSAETSASAETPTLKRRKGWRMS